MWQFRDLLARFARRDLTLRYRQTALGVIWVMLQPLLAAGALAFVFGSVAGLSSDGVPYFAFAFAGMLAWNAFSGVLTRMSGSLVGNAQLVSKIFFPRLVLPLSSLGSVLVDFVVSMAMMVVIWPFAGVAARVEPRHPADLARRGPAARVGRSGLLAAALMVPYRDVQYVLPLAIQLLLFISPVGYALSHVPHSARFLYELNPLTGLLEGFRWSLLDIGHAQHVRDGLGLRVFHRHLRGRRVRLRPHGAEVRRCHLATSRSRSASLSKSYTIRHQDEHHITLAEQLLHRARHPFTRQERETFWALRDVSFDVRKGEVLGVIGRNGAGKSTLLKLLSRITPPTKGEVRLYGRVGSLLEVGTGFHPELTGRENVYLNGAILGMRTKEIDRRFDEIVAFAGVEQFLDTPVKRSRAACTCGSRSPSPRTSTPRSCSSTRCSRSATPSSSRNASARWRTSHRPGGPSSSSAINFPRSGASARPRSRSRTVRSFALEM